MKKNGADQDFHSSRGCGSRATAATAAAALVAATFICSEAFLSFPDRSNRWSERGRLRDDHGSRGVLPLPPPPRRRFACRVADSSTPQQQTSRALIVCDVNRLFCTSAQDVCRQHANLDGCLGVDVGRTDTWRKMKPRGGGGSFGIFICTIALFC